MDAWIQRHLGKPFDTDGTWAQSGRPDDKLLNRLLAHKFFSRKPPKSTGREDFHIQWVEQYLTGREKPEDVQATLLALTATSIVRSVKSFCAGTTEVYLCGGGAHNGALRVVLKTMLPGVRIARTDELGVGADWVEACALPGLPIRRCSDGREPSDCNRRQGAADTWRDPPELKEKRAASRAAPVLNEAELCGEGRTAAAGRRAFGFLITNCAPSMPPDSRSLRPPGTGSSSRRSKASHTVLFIDVSSSLTDSSK